MSKAAVVVDCGWLGHTGVGRVTERFLVGAAELAPADWLLWGPPEVERFAFRGAAVDDRRHGPMELGAQRDILALPKGDVVLALHALRPLAVWRPTVVYLHDTIPLRWDTPARRRWWRSFYVASVRTGLAVVVNSSATAERAMVDLHVPAKSIHVASPSIDRAMVARVRDGRRLAEPGPLLYVGQVKPHKNLARAIEAFQRSAFRRAGGRMIVVGGRRQQGSATVAEGVEVHTDVTDDELIGWYTQAAAVIVPSLEEGYGLPVLEALAAGIPVCCSDIPALRETAQGLAHLFDPWSVGSIADAIDRAVGERSVDDEVRLPSDRDFAAAVISVLD